jgi:hypothetical protein
VGNKLQKFTFAVLQCFYGRFCVCARKLLVRMQVNTEAIKPTPTQFMFESFRMRALACSRALDSQQV